MTRRIKSIEKQNVNSFLARPILAQSPFGPRTLWPQRPFGPTAGVGPRPVYAQGPLGRARLGWTLLGWAMEPREAPYDFVTLATHRREIYTLRTNSARPETFW